MLGAGARVGESKTQVDLSANKKQDIALKTIADAETSGSNFLANWCGTRAGRQCRRRPHEAILQQQLQWLTPDIAAIPLRTRGWSRIMTDKSSMGLPADRPAIRSSDESKTLRPILRGARTELRREIRTGASFG